MKYTVLSVLALALCVFGSGSGNFDLNFDGAGVHAPTMKGSDEDNSEFSVCFWAKGADMTAHRGAASYVTDGGAMVKITLGSHGSSGYCGFYFAPFEVILETECGDMTEWTSICMAVRTGESSRMSIYINKALVSRTDGEWPNALPAGGFWTFGQEMKGVGVIRKSRSFIGSISQGFVYDEHLSSSRASDYYKGKDPASDIVSWSSYADKAGVGVGKSSPSTSPAVIGGSGTTTQATTTKATTQATTTKATTTKATTKATTTQATTKATTTQATTQATTTEKVAQICVKGKIEGTSKACSCDAYTSCAICDLDQKICIKCKDKRFLKKGKCVKAKFCLAPSIKEGTEKIFGRVCREPYACEGGVASDNGADCECKTCNSGMCTISRDGEECHEPSSTSTSAPSPTTELTCKDDEFMYDGVCTPAFTCRFFSLGKVQDGPAVGKYCECKPNCKYCTYTSTETHTCTTCRSKKFLTPWFSCNTSCPKSTKPVLGKNGVGNYCKK